MKRARQAEAKKRGRLSASTINFVSVSVHTAMGAPDYPEKKELPKSLKAFTSILGEFHEKL